MVEQRILLRVATSLAISFLFLNIFITTIKAETTVELQTNFGKFIGVQQDNTATFLGLPYANPPVGKNRFKVVRALEYTDKNRVFNATEFGDKCPHLAGVNQITTGMSEDCLVLNIWAPDAILKGGKNEEKKYPVMVFFHGGAFMLGSGSDTYIDGRSYAQRDTILISVNYRLGSLGFLTYPYINFEENGAEGNLGLIDQRESLVWIHKHISAFGGDPSNILIFGESAGAASVVFHLTSDNSINGNNGEKLFHKAIIQSTVDESLLTTKCRDLEGASTEVVKKAGCYVENDLKKSIECLMNIDAFELIDALGPYFEMRNLFWHTKSNAMPCFDDRFFYAPSLYNIENKHWNFDVPLIIGNTANEGTMFAFMTFPFMQIDTPLYEAILKEVFPGQDYHLIEEHYPLDHYRSAQEALSDVIGDLYFQCFSRKLSNELVTHKEEAKIYRYIFKKVPKFGNQNLGAFHAVELPFVFNSKPGGFLFASDFTEEESRLADHMVTYYTQFAKTGNPNPSSPTEYVEWDSYSLDKKSILVFGDDIEQVNDFKQSVCKFWDENYTGKIEKKVVDELKHERFFPRLINNNGFKLLRNFRKVLAVLFVVLIVIFVFVYKCIKRTCSKPKSTVQIDKKDQ